MTEVEVPNVRIRLGRRWMLRLDKPDPTILYNRETAEVVIVQSDFLESILVQCSRKLVSLPEVLQQLRRDGLDMSGSDAEEVLGVIAAGEIVESFPSESGPLETKRGSTD